MRFVYATLGSLVAFLLIMLTWYYIAPESALKGFMYVIIVLAFVLVFFMGRLSQREEYHQVYFMSAPFVLAIVFYFVTVLLGLEHDATQIMLQIVMILFLILGVGLIVISQGKKKFTYTIASGFALLIFLTMFAFQDADNLPNQNKTFEETTVFLTPFPHTAKATVSNGTVMIPFKNIASEGVSITPNDLNKGSCGQGEIPINVTNCEGSVLEQVGDGKDFCITWYCTQEMDAGSRFKATLGFDYTGEIRHEMTGTVEAKVK